MSRSGDPSHQFKAVSGRVQYALSYVTIPGFHDAATPMSTQQAVDATIKDALAANGIRMLASEAVSVPNADYAKSFVGTNEGLTVAGLGCAAGDRLYLVMTQLDQSDAAQKSAGAAFTASFRP